MKLQAPIRFAVIAIILVIMAIGAPARRLALSILMLPVMLQFLLIVTVNS